MSPVPRRQGGSGIRDLCAFGICSAPKNDHRQTCTALHQLIQHIKRITTHKSVFPTKQFLSFLRLNDPAYTDFPSSTLAPCHCGAQSPSHYLVPVAYTYNLDPILSKHILHEINQSYNPWVIVESIEPYGPGSISYLAPTLSPSLPLFISRSPHPASRSIPQQQKQGVHIRLPVINTASTCSILG